MNENSAINLARPSVSSRKALFLVVALAVAAVMAAACSDSEPSRTSALPAAPPADPAPAPAPGDPTPGDPINDLPEVTVVNVVSGESFELSSLAPADRPILAWFWAPH